MGRRDPNDPRNKLMDSFVEHGIDLGVGYMLMEQVPTLLQPQNAEHLDHLRELLFRAGRSEEHTSELQSLMRISYAVFCLKKKKRDKLIEANNYISRMSRGTNSIDNFGL